ncbi:MAG: hypothetical protein V3V33_12690 [Candidatus Lokiarchaeia archaeon]
MNEHNITISEEIYKRLTDLSKTLSVNINTLIELAFYEFFDLVVSDPYIFLEKVGIIERLQKIITEE